MLIGPPREHISEEEEKDVNGMLDKDAQDESERPPAVLMMLVTVAAEGLEEEQ